MILKVTAIAVIAILCSGFYNSYKLRHIHIQKETTIQGSLDEVFDMVVKLENFPKWSPFLEADPSQKYKVVGEDGEIGVQFHWEGNKGKDLGYQEIVKIKENRFVGIRCEIQKPFKATPTFDYSFSESPKGITVTQDFNLESGAVNGFFMWLFGAKKDMAKMNERGLELLKESIEKK